jgi:hypothetical protein
MIDQGDGSFQRAINAGQCPRCRTCVDYHAEIVTCRTCDLTISGKGIQKQKDPNQLELPFND